MDNTEVEKKARPSTAASQSPPPSTNTPLDSNFSSFPSQTPVIFYTPSDEISTNPEKPLPPTISSFELTTATPLFSKDPTLTPTQGAQHKLPPIMPTPYLGDKRRSTTFSPRAGFVFGKKHRIEGGTKGRSSSTRSLDW